MYSSNDGKRNLFAKRQDPLPLAIGPLSVFKEELQRHPIVYHTIAAVAKQYGIPYVHTLRSPIAMETLADPDPNVERWLELLPFVDVNILRILVQRAEKCRFRAIVLTVDGPEKGNRPKEKDYVRQPDFETMVADLLQNDVDAVILTIGPYTPFCSYIVALQKVQQNPSTRGIVFAGGSCFTEDEVAELVAHGVERVFVDLPALWGLVIDGADGVSNVIEIYKKELSKL
ncbi:2-Hydroxyacid oxidase 2-like [Anopheles cruzii]|uniref:2-Hydroxyacid oxidase 2-like n=1 Tax=Anopheles cruzii TaxID=68878 RepID=UPI0022EC88F7|nr:2-Hydroxyacid oxidase 2-like [Anopheles cruzii]